MDGEDYKIGEEEIQRIKENIWKSGLPLEIETSSKLKEHGWTVLIHDYYLDLEEGKNREIDKLVGSTFLIDVVRKDFLVEYLKILE